MTQQKTAIGYLLPTREIVMAQTVPDLSRIMQLAERAEGLGFDSLWVGDSILARPRLEPLTTLAAAAARTSPREAGHRRAFSRLCATPSSSPTSWPTSTSSATAG